MKDKESINEISEILEYAQERIINILREKGYKGNDCDLHLDIHRVPLSLISDGARFCISEDTDRWYIRDTFIEKEINNIGNIEAVIYTDNIRKDSQ